MNYIVYCCFLGNFLKMFGPVIKAQCENHPDSKPILWICKNFKNYKPKEGTELSSTQINELQKLFPDLIIIESESLSDIVKKYPVFAVVSISFSFPLDHDEYIFLKKRNIKLCTIGYVGEELLYILNNGYEVLDKWDIITTFSTFWIDLFCNIINNTDKAREIRKKIKPIGFVELDQIREFDEKKIREKYKIPSGKKVIYFSTYPYFYSIIPYLYKYIDIAFRKGGRISCRIVSELSQIISPGLEIERIVDYRQILSSLKDTAKKKDYIVITKSRKKHKDPEMIKTYTDHLFYDESYYPFGTLELMYISDIYIGFQSASIIETLFLGKYSATLLPIPRQIYDRGLGSFGNDGIFENYLWRIDGVSDRFKLYKNDEYERYIDFLQRIDNISFNDEQRRLSVEKIFSHDDFKASNRFLDLVFSAI